MRARLAILTAGVEVNLREVVLRDKPDEFLVTSVSATVPCLKLQGRVIDESFDIMLWALECRDPEGWLTMPGQGFELIRDCDGPFKTALDRYKYAGRIEVVDIEAERRRASEFIMNLNNVLQYHTWLFGNGPSLADMAILPFVRQFAHVDLTWFNNHPWPGVIDWLERFKSSDRFAGIMRKYPQWKSGDPPTIFP